MTGSPEFIVGQRVINESEPHLGLGIIDQVPDRRNVTVLFPACGETRCYRIETAPLRRVVLRSGQLAICRSGLRIRVEKVYEEDGLLTYEGPEGITKEADLDDNVPLVGALDRLRFGNVGYPDDMWLRSRGWKTRAAMMASRARGLGGSRVSLLPHQLYVANRVSHMLRPRVVLSDQVGLGKTIEAGLIFSVMRSLGRASRVLLVLPDSLTHQWLAEMARRFNECFTVVGEEALEDESPMENARRVILPWGALRRGLIDEACRYEWDLLIVDEAHHLHEGQPAYEAIASLAELSRSVLLLTATPSRGGKETEFGLLRLVDPQRYTDFDTYCEERESWHKASDLARSLCELGAVYTSTHDAILEQIQGLHPDDKALAQIINDFRTADAEDPEQGAYHRLLESLVDRHGPGRVIYRNRRQRLANLFPGRILNPVPLSRSGDNKIEPVFKPGITVNVRQDPRVMWLAAFVQQHPHEKVVLIAKRMELVVALQERLRDNFGIYAAVFHEKLSLMERDRQAVWFADPEGADVLLCSEIGSEGRNFQFAHNLVLWDIPFHPDVIEQRIGRLDRIGQTQPVNLYVLFFTGGSEERLYRWHEAMGSFMGPIESGEEVVEDVDLVNNLDCDDFDDLIEDSLKLAEDYRVEAEENADYLIDINSFDAKVGGELQECLEKEEADFGLESLICRLLERFGVTVEEIASDGIYELKPGNMMHVDRLAGLHSEGMLATFKREIALEREDVQYLTYDHALVKSVMSMLLDGTEGSAAAVRWRGAPHTGVVIQFLFIFEALGADSLEIQRYLAPTPLMLSVDIGGSIFRTPIPQTSDIERIKPAVAASLWGKLGTRVEALTEKAEALATRAVQPLQEAAVRKAGTVLRAEVSRLEELRKVNPEVSEAEVDEQRRILESVQDSLKRALPRLDALRLVFMDAK